MRGLRGAFAALVLGLVGASAYALPTSGASFEADHGFRFALEPHGWEARAGESTGSSIAVFEAGQTGAAEGPRCDLSYVGQRIATPPSRDRMNDSMRQMRDRFVAAESEHVDVRRGELVQVDGVAVVDIEGRAGILETITRRFAVERRGELRMYTLSCSVVHNDTTGLAAMRAVAASLSFSE